MPAHIKKCPNVNLSSEKSHLGSRGGFERHCLRRGIEWMIPINLDCNKENPKMKSDADWDGSVKAN